MFKYKKTGFLTKPPPTLVALVVQIVSSGLTKTREIDDIAIPEKNRARWKKILRATEYELFHAMVGNQVSFFAVLRRRLFRRRSIDSCPRELGKKGVVVVA